MTGDPTVAEKVLMPVVSVNVVDPFVPSKCMSIEYAFGVVMLLDAADAALVPIAFVAVTVKV